MHVFYTICYAHRSLEVFQKYLSNLIFAKSFEQYSRVRRMLNRQKEKEKENVIGKLPETFVLLHVIFLQFFFYIG